MERVQKIIAHSGYCSRRKAEELISQGRVKVNNKVISIGSTANRYKDKITVNDTLIKTEKPVYYALHKPKGVLVTKSDPMKRKTIYDLPSVKTIPENIIPVGRLDALTEGLVILTNDGDFANTISHPSNAITKTYRVRCEPEFTDEELEQLTTAIYVDERPAKAVEVIIHENERRECILTIHEGRNRIVRRMMEKLGKKVYRLMRIGIGLFEIGTLKEGSIRKLTQKEIKMLITPHLDSKKPQKR